MNRHEFNINNEFELIKITIWMEYNNYASFIGKLNGIGVEVNGVYVQNTLADPEVYINNGRSGFYILMFILGFKSLFTYYQIFKEYVSHIVAFISCSIYFIPLLIVVLLTFKYSHWTILALITGTIISILELIDYSFTIPTTLIAGTNAVMLVFWIVIRIGVLYMFYNAFKWIKKKKALMKE